MADGVAVHGRIHTLSEYFTTVVLLHRRNNADSRTINGAERHVNDLVPLSYLKNGTSQDLIFGFLIDGFYYMRSRSIR